ncbi:MAG: hypothetical protein JW932_17720 [Deltaproteobacteria bacterium]|nr:hypothetical protein [Deltaproteobacteria bacterium]
MKGFLIEPYGAWCSVTTVGMVKMVYGRMMGLINTRDSWGDKVGGGNRIRTGE